MKIAQSKLTAQGQISVPAAVRAKLGLRPGAVLEWELVVRRAGQYSTAEVHQALFGDGPLPAASAHTRQGIRTHVRQRHGRR